MDIFIFDDHQMMRSGLKICFSDSKLYTIAGEAENLVHAKRVVSDYKPNRLQHDGFAVAIVDVGFSENATTKETMQGFELVKFINQSGKNIKCVMYSSHIGQGFVRNALSAEVGAVGYVSKNSETKVLLDAVAAASKGITFIDPYLSGLLVTTDNVFDLLSKREKEVLGFVQKDFTNEQIAKELNISNRTVENHLSMIYTKTGCANKTELMEMFGKL